MANEPPRKVLLLDDEKLLLALYQSKFEKSGYDVSAFSDVDDALSVLRKGFQPDVMLFDITMPDSRSGYEFIETVNVEKLAKHSLKIALTNEGQDAEKARMAELGTDGHFLKANFVPSEIVAKVTEMLDARR